MCPRCIRLKPWDQRAGWRPTRWGAEGQAVHGRGGNVQMWAGGGLVGGEVARWRGGEVAGRQGVGMDGWPGGGVAGRGGGLAGWQGGRLIGLGAGRLVG